MAEFTIRGPIRLIHNGTQWNDFLSPFIQARAWVHGSDPYDTNCLLQFWPRESHTPAWVKKEASQGTLAKNAGIPSPYPIVSLVAVSPFAMLPWPFALHLWIALSTAAAVLAPFAVLWALSCNLAEGRSLLFLAASFALAPVHSGLATANPAIIAVALGVISFLAFKKDRKKTAAILLATALCIKPTVAGGLWLFFAIRREWKISVISAVLVAVVGLIGVSQLAVAGVPWFNSYSQNTRQIFATGSVDDFTEADPVRFNLINIKVGLYEVARSISITNFAAVLIVLLLLASWLWLCHKHRTQSQLLEISAISVLSLIAVYHRFYDAALLIWPVAWSILIARRRSSIILTCLMIAPFFVPGASLLDVLTAENKIPFSLSAMGWWNLIVRPHEVWLILSLCIALLYFLSRDLPDKNSLPFSAVPATAAHRASE
jgi:hypothetical protein